MKTMSVQVPTKQVVERYISLFDNDLRYGFADRALFTVLSVYPTNTVLEHVYIKAALLNDFYNTNIFSIDKMARHIHSINIDSALESGKSEVVEDIASLTIQGKTRRHYSFATKYCSMHFPDIYPIYDAMVIKVLKAYRGEFKFSSFKNNDLINYSKYRQIIDSFRYHFQLTNFSYKEIDKYLWFYGRELSRR